MLSRPQHIIALGFGSGLSPFWPGTVGSLVGFPLFYLISFVSFEFQWLLHAFLFALGVWACQRTGDALGEHDHGAIVWDEIWAMAVTLMFVPQNLLWWAGAFGLFRFFDIVKPWPVSWADRHVPNGFGVMFDDALAAIYAVIVLLILQAAIG